MDGSIMIVEMEEQMEHVATLYGRPIEDYTKAELIKFLISVYEEKEELHKKVCDLRIEKIDILASQHKSLTIFDWIASW